MSENRAELMIVDAVSMPLEVDVGVCAREEADGTRPDPAWVVLIDFGTSLQQVAFSAAEARALAELILREAEHCEAFLAGKAPTP